MLVEFNRGGQKISQHPFKQKKLKRPTNKLNSATFSRLVITNLCNNYAKEMRNILI